MSENTYSRTTPTDPAVRLNYSRTTPTDQAVRLNYSRTTPTDQAVRLNYSRTTPTDRAVRLNYSRTTPTDRAVRLNYSRTTPTDPAVRLNHSRTTPTDPAVRLNHSRTTPTDRAVRLNHSRTTPTDRAVRLRVGLFGGTFDPIHRAHLRVAHEAMEKCNLHRVLFVPAGRPPHKEFENVTPYEDRFKMVVEACAEESRFEASRLEQPPASSYSIDTVKRLRDQLDPGSEVFFLIGSDAFDEIESWKRWRELVELVTFIVAARPGSQYNVPQGANVIRMDSLALAISSSDIRERLTTGRATPELPDAVCEYIRARGLYRMPGNY